MKIDWQEFEDGGLGEEAMKQAKNELKSNPAAQKELKGLGAFRKAVRSAVMAEPVPDHKLNACLKEVCGRKAAPLWQRPLGFAAVGACAIALALIYVHQPDFSQVLPGGGDIRFSTAGSFEKDYEHLATLTPVQIPYLNLQGVATYKDMHASKANVTLRLEAKGEEFTLTVTQPGREAKGEVVQAGGHDFVKVDDALCWKCPNAGYRLAGGSKETRAWLANQLTQHTGYLPPGRV